MTKFIDEDVYFVVQKNWQDRFYLGVYRSSWSFDSDFEFTGAIAFDDKPPIPLNGSVVNNDTLLLQAEQNGLLEDEFSRGRFLKMSFGTGWVQLDLTGSRRAIQLLDQCARRVWPGAGDEEEAIAAEAREQSGVPAPELEGLRQEMAFRDARSYLLEAGWQALHVIPEGDSPSDQEMRNEFAFPELVTCSGTGMGFCIFGFRDAYGRELRVTTRGGEEFILHAWKVVP